MKIISDPGGEVSGEGGSSWSPRSGATGREYEHGQRSVNRLSGILKGVRFTGQKKKKKN